MPKDHLRSLNPLSESERYQLTRLRLGESQPEALQRREKELALERRLQAQLDRKAAAEAKYSKRVAELRIDCDVISAEIHKISPSGVSWRFVDEDVQKLAKLVPTQSFFGTRSDSLDRDALMLFAEIGLAVFEASTKQKPGALSLRERMQSVKIDVGQDGPGEGGAAPDNRAALAQAIVRAGRRRRGEES